MKTLAVALVLLFCTVFISNAENEPNDWALTANILTLNGSNNGSLSAIDNVDWYKIVITTDGRLKINTTSQSALCVGAYLYDQDSIAELANNYWQGNYCNDTSKTFEYSVTPGTYYIKCLNQQGAGNYSISSIFVLPLFSTDPEPNNIAAQASVLAPNSTSTGHLGYHGNGLTDNTDWWKITLTTDTRLRINTTSQGTLCVGAFLYDQDSTTELTNNYWVGGLYCNDTSKSMEYSLIPGTYYIKCLNENGYGSYSITSTSILPIFTTEAEPNNMAIQATTLTPNNTSTGHLGYHGGGLTDNIDWWKITLTADARLRVNTTSQSTLCVGAFLYDQDSTIELTNNYWVGGLYCNDTSKSLEYSLLPGTYYIKCINESGYGAYSISSLLILPIMTDDAEPNDSAELSIVLPLNDSLTGHLGYYGNVFTDIYDWYKITTTDFGRLVVNTKSQISLCVGAYLIASDTTTELVNNYWQGNYCNDTSKTMYSGLLTPGTYFIRCNRESGYGAYRLKNMFEPVPTAHFGYTGYINSFSFTDSSMGATSYLWSFGDGATSTLVNPQHTYQQPGMYNVCLITSNVVGSDTFCLYVNIKGIKNVEVNKAGNTGDATIYVYGGGFTTNTTFKLTRSGYPDIVGDTVIIPCVGAIRSTFDLRNQSTGLWNVVVNIPGDTTMTLVDGFTIEAGVAADPWVDIIGRDRIVFNRNQTYTITYGNNGNVDATGVPLWIVVQNEPGITVTFEGFEVELPKVAIDSGWTVIKDSIPIYYDVDSLFGEPFNARIYGFYIPIIPAGQTESVKMIIKSDQNVKVMAWVNTPYFQSPLSNDFKTCIALAAAKMLTNGIGLVSPIGSCVHSITTTYIYDWTSYKQPQPQTPKTWGSQLWNLTTTALSCAGALTPMGMALNWAVNVTTFAADFSSSWDAAMSCKEAYGQKSRKDKSIRAVSSLDPNEIIGPSGYTTENYSLKNGSYSYTIFFENFATATAPAQEVVIIDTLNPLVYDFNNFSFSQVSFGDSMVVPVSGQREFTKDVDLRPAKNIILRIDAKLDTISGVIKWHFLSLDPVNLNLTEDPAEGFLPPNVTSPEGEGSVSYNVGLKASLVHGTPVKAKASIVFDMNPAIATNEWLNTLDMALPQSNILPLNSVINDTVFELHWTGTDAGSGIRNYTIFVSENDSDFVAWKSYTPETSAFFTGHFGSNYKFYSIAYDSLGLTELIPSLPDAETQLQLSVDDKSQNPCSLNIFPNPANDGAKIVFNLTETGNVKLRITDLQGREVKLLMNEIATLGFHTLTINTKEFNAGVYFVIIETESSSTTKKFSVLK